MGLSVINEFYPRSKKQSQEVIFSLKSKPISHSPLVFNNNNNAMQASSQKHLGITLDTRLSFEKHLQTVLCKIHKTIGLTCKLQTLALTALCKAFVSPHLDYGDILYGESLQYNDCLAITGAIRGSSRGNYTKN